MEVEDDKYEFYQNLIGLPRSPNHHDSFWVIVNKTTKLAHFSMVKTIH